MPEISDLVKYAINYLSKYSSSKTNLERILKNKINLGLDVGSSEILSEISNETKPMNFAYSLGIDLLKNYFSFQIKPFKNFRNKTITLLNKNNYVKNIFFNLADKGFRF